jgi:CBS domain-containing protein
VYTKLDLSIYAALQLRSNDFAGVVTCSGSDSLGKLLEFIGGRKVHRLVVVDPESGKLTGIITLSDILKYLVKDSMSFPLTPLHPSMESTVETETEE